MPTQNASYQAHMEEKMTRVEAEEDAQWEASQTTIQKRAEEKIVQPVQNVWKAVTAPASTPHLAMVTPALALDNDPPWWKKLIDSGKKVVADTTKWANDHVVQPAKDTFNKIVTTVQNIVTTTVATVQKTYEVIKKDIKQKWEYTKHWVNTNVVQPAKDTVNKVVTTVTNIATAMAVTAQDYYQRYQIWNDIRKEYGWYVNPLYTQTQLNLIKQTGDNMKSYVDRITNNNGDIWMDEYMSGVIFVSAGNSQRPFSIGPFVFLNQGWDKYSGPLSMPLTHEFGHVWDWRTGSIDPSDLHPIKFIQDWRKNGVPNLAILTNGVENGVSDQLNTFIGGTVVNQDGIRIEDGGTTYKYTSDEYLWDGKVLKDPKDANDDLVIQNHTSPLVFNGGYGNNATADYLCETLNAAIYNPGAIPDPIVQQWLEDTILAQTDALVNGTPVTPVPTLTPTPTPTLSPTPTSTTTPTLTPTAQPSVTATPSDSPMITTPALSPATTDTLAPSNPPANMIR